MRMFNGELKGFTEFLLGLELAGKSSRMRSRFIKLVNERLQENEESRIELVTKYANRDENGNPRIENNVFDIPDDNIEILNTEFNEVLSEEFILDDTEERLDMLRSIRDAVLSAEGKKFSGMDAARYDRWCDVVETIE